VKKDKKRTIGRVDKIDLPEFDIYDLPVKIDTGASRSSIHCSQFKQEVVNGEESLSFHLSTGDLEKEYHTTHFTTKKIRSSSGHAEERFIVNTKAVIFGEEYDISLSLNNRSKMKYPALLGRRLLRQSFIVDVAKKNLSYNHKIKK
jgi:hypothetical protein